MALSDVVGQFQTRQGAVLRQIAGNKAQVSKRARWTLRGNKYMRGRTVPRAGAMVQVDPALVRNVAGLIEQVAPTTADAYNRHLVRVAEYAFDHWPVDTGLSKSLLALEFSINDAAGEFSGDLVNRAPYAIFIKSPRPVVPELVWKPGDVAARRIARDIAKGMK